MVAQINIPIASQSSTPFTVNQSPVFVTNRIHELNIYIFSIHNPTCLQMKSIVSISMLPEQVATPDNYVYFLAQAAQIPTKSGTYLTNT